MVELATLQTISYIAGATSVCFGVIYFVVNLRETNKNRRITATANLLQSILTPEWLDLTREVGAMQWSDFDDFRKKYDHSVNWNSYANRMMYWGKYDVMGSLLKRGLIDIDTLYSVVGQNITTSWIRWKPIIEEYRRISYGLDSYVNWEYAAFELAKYKIRKDPNWVYSTENFTPEIFEKTFGKLASK